MLNEFWSSSRIWFICTILIILIGIFGMLYFTRTGPALRGDSVRYVMGADLLIEGKGYSRVSGGGEIYPETGFAPFFSIVLALFGLMGIDMYDAGHVLNIFLYAGNMMLVALLIFRSTRSGVASAIGAMLFLSSDVIFEWHAWLMTEPLFIFLILVSINALSRFIDGGPYGYLILAAITGGAASITRYIGISFLPAGALAILAFGRGESRRRIGGLTAFLVIGLTPFSVWMLRNQALDAGAVANREIILHAIRPEILKAYLFELASWFIPEKMVIHRIIRAVIASIIAIGGPGYFIWTQIKHRSKGNQAEFSHLWIIIFYIPCYLGLLAVNSLLLDAGTTFEGAIRYMVPLLVVVIVLEVSTYHYLIKNLGLKNWVIGLVIVYAVSVIVLSGLLTAQLASSSTSKLGFTDIRSSLSEVAEFLRQQDPSIPIISNNPERIYYLLNRPAYMKPIEFDVYQRAVRSDFDEQMSLASQRLRDGSYFVFFDKPSQEEKRILEQLPLEEKFSAKNVIIYGYEEP